MMDTLLDSFANKVLVGDGCWQWTGAKSPTGYGHLGNNGRTLNAHKAMYELLIGSVPTGLDLDHLCRNRACVNPAHLEPVDRSTNLRRGAHWKRDRETCPKGHPYDIVEANGARRCRTCKNATARARYWRER